MKNKLTKAERSWILYDVANSAYVLIISTTIFQIFFKSVIAANLENYESTALWGLGVSIATIIIAVLSPILGTIADYQGYKKKFFAFFFIIGCLATFMLAIPGEGNITLALVLYIISSIGLSGSTVFYDSFLTDVTTDEKMDKLSTSGYAFGYIGSCIPFIFCIALINFGLFGLSSETAVKISMIVAAAWWLIFTIPMLKNVKQNHYVERESNPVLKSFIRLLNTFKNIRKYKLAFLFMIAYFFYIDGVHTIINMATSFGMDLGIEGGTLTIILLVGQIVAFPAALTFGKLAYKYPVRNLIMVCIGIYIAVTVYAIFMTSVIEYWIIAICVVCAQGGIQALSRSYFGKLIPKKNSSEFFGFFSIFGKFAAILGPALMSAFSISTRNSRYGVLSISILFIAGMFVMSKLPAKKVSKA